MDFTPTMTDGEMEMEGNKNFLSSINGPRKEENFVLFDGLLQKVNVMIILVFF